MKGCDSLLTTKYSLKRHNEIHANKKKYICKVCQKAFVLPQYLEEHEYTHSGAKPFICGIAGCQEVFRQRGKLSMHRKIVHSSEKLAGQSPHEMALSSHLEEVKQNQFEAYQKTNVFTSEEFLSIINPTNKQSMRGSESN